MLAYLEKGIRDINSPCYKEREAVLVFVEELLARMELRLADYVVEMKRVCFDTYRKDYKSNTLRAAALAVILKIVSLQFPLLDAEALGVAEMAQVVNADISGTTAKLGVGMRSVMLRLLGAFAERYPGAVQQMVRQMLSLFMETMAEVANSKSLELAVMAAAMDGLSGVLVHSRSDFCANQQYRQAAYFYMTRGMVPLEGVQRYELPRAALRLLHKHADLFAEYLTVDCVKILECLTQGPKALCRHQNKDVRSLSYKALEAFFKQVSTQLCLGKRNQQKDVADFSFFVKKFFEMVQTELDSRSDIQIAVAGFGAFAPAIARFLGQKELKNVLNKLFQLSDRVISGQRAGESQDRAQIHLGSFVQAFAMLIFQLDDLDEHSLQKLAQLIRKLFDVYPLMFPKQRKAQSIAISHLFVSLYSKNSCLRTLMQEITKKCLVLTCSIELDFSKQGKSKSMDGGNAANVSGDATAEQGSAPPAGLSASEARRLETSSVAGKPWLTYLPLWRVMLKPLTLRDVDFPEDFVNEVSAVVYDELMRAIMSLLGSLNLSSVPVTLVPSGDVDEVDAEELAAAAAENLVVQYPADHEILQNLASFCEDLLQKSHQKLFCRRWVFLFGERLIQSSAELPEVAGFYRLMAIVFRICESERYFEGLETDSTSLLANVAEAVRAHAAASTELVSASGMAASAITTREVTFLLFSKFVAEIVSRAQQFKV